MNISNFLANNYNWIIPSFISILGILFAYFGINRNFNNAIKQKKHSVSINKTEDFLFEISKYIFTNANIGLKFQNKNINEEEMFAHIISYGSIEAIRIINTTKSCILDKRSLMSKIKSTNNSDSEELKELITKIDVLEILIIVQIKYDITSEFISPEILFKHKYSDNHEDRKRFAETNNSFIKELGLNKKFKVKILNTK